MTTPRSPRPSKAARGAAAGAATTDGPRAVTPLRPPGAQVNAGPVTTPPAVAEAPALPAAAPARRARGSKVVRTPREELLHRLGATDKRAQLLHRRLSRYTLPELAGKAHTAIMLLGEIALVVTVLAPDWMPTLSKVKRNGAAAGANRLEAGTYVSVKNKYRPDYEDLLENMDTMKVIGTQKGRVLIVAQDGTRCALPRIHLEVVAAPTEAPAAPATA